MLGAPQVLAFKAPNAPLAYAPAAVPPVAVRSPLAVAAANRPDPAPILAAAAPGVALGIASRP